MTIDFKRFRIAVSEDAQVSIFLQGPSEVDQVAVGLGGKRRISKTRTDGPGDVKRGRAFRHFLGTAVGKLEMNTV